MLRRCVNTVTERGRGRHEREQHDRKLLATSTEQRCTITHKQKTLLLKKFKKCSYRDHNKETGWAGRVAYMTYQLQNLKGRGHFGDLRVHKRLILRNLKEIGCEGIKWTHVANVGIGNFWIPLTAGNFFASWAHFTFSKSDTGHQQRLHIS